MHFIRVVAGMKRKTSKSKRHFLCASVSFTFTRSFRAFTAFSFCTSSAYPIQQQLFISTIPLTFHFISFGSAGIKLVESLFFLCVPLLLCVCCVCAWWNLPDCAPLKWLGFCWWCWLPRRALYQSDNIYCNAACAVGRTDFYWFEYMYGIQNT